MFQRTIGCLAASCWGSIVENSLDWPGPPWGPKYRSITTVFSPFFIDPLSTAATNSSSESNARALPTKPSPSFPVILATAPPGARFPFSILGQGRWTLLWSGVKINQPNMSTWFNWVVQWSNEILSSEIQFPKLMSPLFEVFTQSTTCHCHVISVY